MEQVLLRIYFVVQKLVFSQVDKETFDAIINQGKVLEKDRWGVKVIETTDNKIVKFFRLKRVYSSALFFPYAWRFKRNANHLKRLGIKTMEVEKIEYCLSQQRHILTYKKLEGQSVKDKLSETEEKNDLINHLIKFISELHAKGVYFRSLHFGNIIIDSKGDLSLIDISDLKVYTGALSVNHRVRNWKHLLKYDFEKKLINEYGCESFFDRYLGYANLSQQQGAYIMKELLVNTC